MFGYLGKTQGIKDLMCYCSDTNIVHWANDFLVSLVCVNWLGIFIYVGMYAEYKGNYTKHKFCRTITSSNRLFIHCER